MNQQIPDYTNINFAIDKESAKAMIDWGVSLYNERKEIREINKRMYDSYNGIVNQEKVKNITSKTGHTSSTPYVSYRIGRNKLKQLFGEFLQIGIKATVYTVNPEARKEKYDKYLKMKTMADAKPQLEKLRQLGHDVFSGVSIPNPDQVKITDPSFKSQNEIIMQILIDWKVLKDNMIMDFLENWKQLCLTCEPCGKLDRDENGEDYWRPLDPNNAIFLEAPNEVIVKRSPIVGEYRLMYEHELIKEFNLSKDEIKKLKEIGSESDDFNSNRKAGHSLYPVYSFQWVGKKIIRRKLGKNSKGIEYLKFIKEDTYEKEKDSIEKDVKKGKYSILDETSLFTIFEGTRIGNSLYVGIQEKENNVVWTDESGFKHLEFDYRFGLFGTVGGVRVSLQEIIYEMEKIYDAIRRQLNIEISKLKGSFAAFDEAFMGNKTLTTIYHELSEHGFTTVNSADAGMVSDERDSVVDKIVKEFKLGDSQTINTLLNLALDIEQTLERQTGMNNDRAGFGSASSTATTNQNNVNASVSMTYDMFQFMQYYMNDVISILAEKMKINWPWLENHAYGLLLSDEQYGYLKATRDLSNDSYGTFITDGRLEFDIARKLEPYFLQDINSSKLRTVDVAKFYTNKSFAQGMKILEDAYSALTKAQQEGEASKSQSNEKIAQMNIEESKAAREDLQQHDKDIVVLKGKMKENEIITKGNIEKGINTENKVRDHMRERDKIKLQNQYDQENEEDSML